MMHSAVDQRSTINKRRINVRDQLKTITPIELASDLYYLFISFLVDPNLTIGHTKRFLKAFKVAR